MLRTVGTLLAMSVMRPHVRATFIMTVLDLLIVLALILVAAHYELISRGTTIGGMAVLLGYFAITGWIVWAARRSGPDSERVTEKEAFKDILVRAGSQAVGIAIVWRMFYGTVPALWPILLTGALSLVLVVALVEFGQRMRESRGEGGPAPAN